MPKSKKVIVIGAGFAGLSASCYLAKSGFQVTLLEKNDALGGRARMFEDELGLGFKFDMGPSWYWMPEVFEKFFGDFNKKPSDYYQLIQLDPAFQMFTTDSTLNFPAKIEDIFELFEKYEPGSSKALKQFLEDGKSNYENGINDYMLRPSKSIFEFASLEFLNGVLRGGILKSYGAQINKKFQSSVLRELLKFPVLFLGGKPDDIPYLYNLLAYSMFDSGTLYPMGGMYKIVEAMTVLATELGVEIRTNCTVAKINIENQEATSVLIEGGEIIKCDSLIAGADYHHVEQKLLDSKHRRYTEDSWNRRVMSPSSLVFYLGVKGKVDGLEHHNLFFDTSFDNHAESIYDTKIWPEKPLFYVCCPSKTDSSVAPRDCENLFALIPLAPGIEDNETIREKYFKIILERMESKLNISLEDKIIYKRSYCLKDFEQDYNSYKGNAYGLANTLSQTAIFKPSIHSPKVKNMFYAGQLTVPGPGIPPAIFSGKIAAGQVQG